MAHGRVGIGASSTRLGWILASIAVHMILMLGLVVVGFEFVVRDRPCRRNTAVMPDLAKILFTQPEQSRAVKFRVSADVIVSVRMKVLAVAVFPYFFGVIFRLQVDGDHRDRKSTSLNS